jgi:hypothetical protein
MYYVQTFGFLFCVVGFYSPVFASELNNIAIFAGFITYFSQIIGYLMLQGRFARIERTFRSPLGLFGAGFCTIVFGLGVVASIVFAGAYIAVLTNVALCGLLSIYYYRYVEKTQALSKEEQTTLFRMNVINAALRRKRGKSFRWVKKGLIRIKRMSKIFTNSELAGFATNNSSKSSLGSTAGSDKKSKLITAIQENINTNENVQEIQESIDLELQKARDQQR